MPPTTESPRLPLLRVLPFVVLGALGLAFFAGPSLQGFTPTSAPPPVTIGHAVKVTAGLERGALFANRTQEVFARVELLGQDLGPKKSPQRLPLALTLVIDTSGSMSGDKIENARTSAIAVLDLLRADDRVSVVTFSSGADLLVSSASPATGLEAAKRVLRGLEANGGTDMRAGLAAGGDAARRLHHDGSLSRVLLLSDGQPDTEAGLVDQVRALAQQGILTTTLGIGRDYNEDLMARLADAGLGHYYFVEDASHMTRIFQEEVESLSQVVARAAEVSLVPSPGVMIRQVVGYPSRNVGQVTVVPVGAVYAGKRADLLVRLTVDAGVAAAQAALLTVTTSWVETGTGQPGQDMRGLQATFTTDEHRVERSVVPEVVAKAEKVRTAEALELATEAYKQGKSDDARRILQTTKDKVEAFRGSAAGKKYAPQAASMLDDLDSFEAAAEAPAADMKVLEKKTKAKARSMKKH